MRFLISILKGRSRRKMDQPNKEELCKRCGKCCCDKILINNTIYNFLNNPCKYLVKYENGKCSCSVYEKRHELTDQQCLTIEDAIKMQILPADCGYRELFPEGYQAPTEVKSIRDLRNR